MSVNAGNVTILVNYDTAAAARGLQDNMRQQGNQAANALGAAATNRLQILSTQMAAAGRNMFYSFTLPLIGIGKKAADAFLPFEKALVNIEGLVDIDRAVVQSWGNTIIDTAPKFGIMADEAGRALYFITSSGIEAADAMSVLNASLTGAQAGLGSAETVADLVTTALNAYNLSVDQATKITDQLTVAVREGKAEAEEFAVAAGRVVPIAAEMGVSFDQVVGSLAAMTLPGAKVDEAATQLSQVMNTLLDPSVQAQQALAQVGLTAEDLRKKISRDGLQAALLEMRDAFGGNTSAMAQVFGNIRALRGMFNLTGKSAAETSEILRKTAAAEGETARAAEIAANSVGGRLDKSLATLNSRMIDVGATVVPIFGSLVDGAASVAGAFSAVGPAAQVAIVGAAGLAAAGGPLLLVGSSIVKGWTLVAGSVTKAAYAMRFLGLVIKEEGLLSGLGALRQMINSIGTGGAVAIAAAAVIGLGIAWKQANEEMGAAGDAVRRGILADATDLGGVAGIDKALGQAERAREAFKDIARFDWNVMAEIGSHAQIEQQTALIDKLNGLKDAAMSVARETNVSADAMANFALAMDAQGTDVSTPEKLAEAWKKYAGTQNEAAQRTAQTGSAIGRLRSAAEAGMGAFFSVVDAQRTADQSTRDLADAEDTLKSAIEKRKSLEIGGVEYNNRLAAARQKVTDAERQQADAVRRVADARRALSALESGLSVDESLSIESAQLALEEAIASQQELGKGATDLDRRRADLSVRQARRALEQAQSAHGEALEEARRELADAQAQADDANRAVAEARSGLTETQTQLTKDLADATKAERDAAWGVESARWAQFKAFDALVPAQATFNALLGTENERHKANVDYIEDLKNTYPEMAASAVDAYNRIAVARSRAEGTPTPDTDDRTLLDLFRGTPQRAYGGPLAAGQMSSITERGLPEVWEAANGTSYFIPPTDGRVVPLARAESATGRASSRPAVQTGDINIYGVDDPRRAAAETTRQLRKRAFLAGGR